ncbi:hypothetical protein TWF225_003703 [Orbilia oligospora]|nr:hypothetical protein TWF225_003703 [Orbilia oligospora]KAF3267614.1 hypothetical protein TWF128_009138 [Orbilia oligospora]KAF3269177.1 hypothetical protein TWF217_009274 [Orbilia oligospora]
MSTQTPPLHPLVNDESLTSTLLSTPSQREQTSTLFFQVEEFEYLGKFHEAYKALQNSPNRHILASSSPSYWYLFGTIKLSQGYYRDGLEQYRTAEKLLRAAKEEDLSDGSQQLLAFMTTRTLCLDPASSPEDREIGIETGITAYQKWAKEKSPEELDYFSLILERSYYEIIKDIPLLSDPLPSLLPRHIQILKSQIPKKNAIISFPIFLAIINNSKSLPEIQSLSPEIESLLSKHNCPTTLQNTIKGYFQLRMGQLSERPDVQGKHFKEARRFYKLAGNIEAPCEVDLLDCLRDGQKHVLVGTDDPTDLRRRILHMIEKLGKLYGKFTDLDFPNRMHTTLKQISNINEKMLQSPDITLISCRLWRLLGKATGIKINSTTEFIAVIADIMKTEDLEDAIAVFERFKAEEEDNWDFDTGINWLRGMAVAHTRLSQFDEAIAEMEMAEVLLQSEYKHSTALEVREQVLAVKERRLHTLSGIEKGYAFDDLLEEITEAIMEDSRYWQQRKPMLRKMLWKASLLLGDKELTPIEESTKSASEIVAQVEQLATEYITEDKTYQTFLNDCQLLKAILLRDQGKPDEAVALIEKLLPSKLWKLNLKPRTEEEEIHAADLHIQVVIMYMKDLTSSSSSSSSQTSPPAIPPKLLEKRIKSCFTHTKEALKLSEKHNLPILYSDALFYESHLHLLQKDPKRALQNLHNVARIQDELRRASPKGDKFDSFITNALAAQTSSARFVDLALKACLQLPDPVAAWYWIQKAKARAFTDMLQHGHIWQNSFIRITDDIENSQMPWEFVSINGSDIALLYRLENLLKSPVGYTLDNWDIETMETTLAHRRRTISSLIDEISQRPSLRGALSVSMGLPATHEDLTWIANYRQSTHEIVFIDWAESFDQIIICIYRPAGIRFLSPILSTSQDARINIFTCPLSITDVKNWVQTYILNQDAPLSSLNSTDDLKILSPLIDPIKALTNPEDLLVLSPTGILHSIPFHALPISTDDKDDDPSTPLISRNPIVYVPSPSILRQCIAKLRMTRHPNPQTQSLTTATRPSTLIGVKIDDDSYSPTPDQKVDTSLEKMSSSLLTAEILTHEMVTHQSFTHQSSLTTDILHFHGHMDYHDPRPLSRYLVLANDEIITGRQLADLKFPVGSAPLVTIIACLSGGQQILMGDEPVGIVPALLAAGAASVIATMWPTDSACGLKFGEILYEDRRLCDENEEGGGGEGGADDIGKTWDIARALRKAVLDIRNDKETSAPYYWAPFVLNGAWLRGTKNGGALPRGDGMDGFSAQFARGMEIRI